MDQWRWETPPRFADLAAPDRLLVQTLRTIFPENMYQLYTPANTPDEHRVYCVLSNADDSPYEAWISASAVRNHKTLVETLLHTRLYDPDICTCREIVRDQLVIALDIAGCVDDSKGIVVESYDIGGFPDRPTRTIQGQRT